MAYFQTDKLAVGYKGKVLIHDIDINIELSRNVAAFSFVNPF